MAQEPLVARLLLYPPSGGSAVPDAADAAEIDCFAGGACHVAAGPRRGTAEVVWDGQTSRVGTAVLYVEYGTQEAADTAAGVAALPRLVGGTVLAMSTEWGHDRMRFDGFCLAGAARAARLLVPVRELDADRDVPWSQALEGARLDGQADWSRLTELPGAGRTGRTARYRSAAGQLPAAFVAELLAALPAPLRAQQWHCEPWPVHTVLPGAPVHAPLEMLLGGWPNFPGRVSVSGGGTGLAAPPYADSVVLSGPAAVVDAVLASGLEAFPVDRWDPLPRLTD